MMEKHTKTKRDKIMAKTSPASMMRINLDTLPDNLLYSSLWKEWGIEVHILKQGSWLTMIAVSPLEKSI